MTPITSTATLTVSMNANGVITAIRLNVDSEEQPAACRFLERIVDSIFESGVCPNHVTPLRPTQ